MIYLEYEEQKKKKENAKRLYSAILDEKMNLFARTQPTATTYDDEKVLGGETLNSFDQYLIAKEEKEIDKRLQECLEIIAEQENLLKLKEQELRESKALYDKIYRMYYLDNIRVYIISLKLNYSVAHTYRALDKIKENLKDEKK